jgi:hypothetical protein
MSIIGKLLGSPKPTGGNTVNTMLTNAPLPALVQKMGEAIADAQYTLDTTGIQVFNLMADAENNGIMLPGRDAPTSMLELGFAPTFYHYSETTIESKVAFSSTESSESHASIKATFKVAFFSVSISASYTQKYSFSAEGSSSIKAKLVSVPAPSALSDIINDLRTERAAALAAEAESTETSS